MAKNTSLQNVQEIVMAISDKNESARRTAMLKEGALRKIAPKVYTTTMDEDPEVIIKRNLFYVLGQLYPHAVISHRSAYELKPTVEGDIFLTYTYTKNVSLPGVTVHLMQGTMGTEHDMPFIENLYISSAERRALEKPSERSCPHQRVQMPATNIYRRKVGAYASGEWRGRLEHVP